MKKMSNEMRDDFRTKFRRIVEIVMNERAEVSFPEKSLEDASAVLTADIRKPGDLATWRVVVTDDELVMNAQLNRFQSLVISRLNEAEDAIGLVPGAR